MVMEHSVKGKKVESKQTQFQLKKISRPKNWREEIENVKQPCWCKEQWCDNHEDGNHGPVLVKVPITPVLGKRKAASAQDDDEACVEGCDASESEAEKDESEEDEDESEEELEEGWQHGWYGPVRCEE